MFRINHQPLLILMQRLLIIYIEGVQPLVYQLAILFIPILFQLQFYHR